MRYKRKSRRGTVVVLVAVSLVAVISVLAIAVDGGVLLENRRSAQAAADAAAMAAATDLFNNYVDGLDTSGTAKTSAKTTAAANGFNNDGVTSVVTVNIPPTSGNFSGKAGYAEVIIQRNQKRGFSGIFGSADVPVRARAVARGKCGDIGILILDPTLQAACEIDGIVNILNGGQVFCNSSATSPNDSPLTGSIYVASTSKLTCGGLNCVGDLNQLGSITYTNGGKLNDAWTGMKDSLANIPEPVPSGTNYGNQKITADTSIDPGIYGDITVDKGATLTMKPGIYYISSSGSITLKNDSKLVGDGVMIYNQGGDHLDFQDAGGVVLTPPTSGTYRGISIFQPRSETREIHIKSQANVTITGTLYAQGGEFDLRPNGASVVFRFGNYICDQAEWGQGFNNSGTSNGTIYMDPTTAAPTLRPQLVE